MPLCSAASQATFHKGNVLRRKTQVLEEEKPYETKIFYN